MVQKNRTKSSKWQVRVYRPRTRVLNRGAPGREGPAMSGFFVEPFPLDFWKLEKSFSRTRVSSPFYPPWVRRFINNIRSLPLSPYHRYACYTIVAFLVIPSASLSESFNQDARNQSTARHVFFVHDGLLIVAVVHTARRRHSRSESPEILGRVVFFITAVGRSPPSCLAL
jgi:hypothetical protein